MRKEGGKLTDGQKGEEEIYIQLFFPDISRLYSGNCFSFSGKGISLGIEIDFNFQNLPQSSQRNGEES